MDDAIEMQEARMRKAQADVMYLLGELRKIFDPRMKITFVARNPENKDEYTFLSEDNVEQLADHIRTMKPPAAVDPVTGRIVQEGTQDAEFEEVRQSND